MGINLNVVVIDDELFDLSALDKSNVQRNVDMNCYYVT